MNSSRPSKAQRNQEIITAYLSGVSIIDIGLHHNISRQRVWQIITDNTDQRREKTYNGVPAVSRFVTMDRVIADLSNLTQVKQLAKKYNISDTYMSQLCTRKNIPVRKLANESRYRQIDSMRKAKASWNDIANFFNTHPHTVQRFYYNHTKKETYNEIENKNNVDSDCSAVCRSSCTSSSSQ